MHTNVDLFIELAELGLETSLTVSVRGTIITGKSASWKDYAAYIKETYVDALRKDGHEKSLQIAAKIEGWDELKALEERTDGEAAHGDAYLFLKDAQILTSDGTVLRSPKMWWKIRAHSVDAVMIGEFSNKR
jgi:hypothetical protein